MLQDLCKVGKLDTSKLFTGGDGDEEEREEKVTVGKLKLVNWEAANKEETGEVKREVVKVNPDPQVSQNFLHSLLIDEGGETEAWGV